MLKRLVVALGCGLSGTALAQTADFDTLVEGTNGAVIIDNGIRFSNVDNALGPGPGNAAIEDASDTLAGFPGFSANNCLGFGGYSDGPGAAFGRFRSVDIARREPANAGRVEVFDMGSTAVTVRLEAWLADVMVNVAEVQLPSGYSLAHHTLEVQGETFDKLTLRVDPDTGEVAFILIDNVTIGNVAVEDTDVATDTDTDDPPHTGEDRDTDVNKTLTGEDNAGSGDTDTAASTTKSGCGCASDANPTSAWIGAAALALAGLRRRARHG